MAIGRRFKQDMLGRVQMKLSDHSRLWGCQEAGVQGALKEWEGGEWADARALLSISWEHGVTIAVDSDEKMVDAVSSLLPHLKAGVVDPLHKRPL